MNKHVLNTYCMLDAVISNKTKQKNPIWQESMGIPECVNDISRAAVAVLVFHSVSFVEWF